MGGVPSLEIDLVYALSLAGMRSREADLRRTAARLRGRPCPSPTWRSALRRLQQRRLVFRARRDDRGPIVRLTLRGRVRASLPPMRSAPLLAPEGMLFFVSYDIPLSMGNVRRDFAGALARQGWQRVHKSLWVSGLDLRTEAMEAVEELGLQPHVRLGTCVFLEEFTTKPSRAAVTAPQAMAAVEQEAGKNPGTAFRRWVDATEMLRKPGNAEALSPELRQSWRVAYRKLVEVVASQGT